MSNQIKVELQSTYGTDRDISEAAWTSSLEYQAKELKNDTDVKRVINMLADAKHSVPFESVIFRFWMRVPIAIDRQIMTHRIASHSGMSGRYRTMPNEWLSTPDDVKTILSKISESEEFSTLYHDRYENACRIANEEYQALVQSFKIYKNDNQISNDEFKRLREFFRGMLPQHNMTERVTIMNLRAWCNFYRLRSKSDAQIEIQTVAKLMLEQIKASNKCPLALEALERNGWNI